jgi:hypothetical protein
VKADEHLETFGLVAESVDEAPRHLGHELGVEHLALAASWTRDCVRSCPRWASHVVAKDDAAPTSEPISPDVAVRIAGSIITPDGYERAAQGRALRMAARALTGALGRLGMRDRARRDLAGEPLGHTGRLQCSRITNGDDLKSTLLNQARSDRRDPSLALA